MLSRFVKSNRGPVTGICLLLCTLAVKGHAALPPCASASSDSDGDGYGWENSQSCRVVIADQPGMDGQPNVLPGCVSADSDPDGDGFGWENNQSCRVTVVDNRPNVCTSAESDPDGDGWGWENDRSCRVSNPETPSETPSNTSSPSPSSIPACQLSGSDPDGDGWGWENDQSCRVESSSDVSGEFRAISPSGVLSSGEPVFVWNAYPDAELYSLAVFDRQGNGYDYQIDPLRAGCQSGEGTCSATPDLAYYDNDLTWRVKTIVDGVDGPETARLAITTPRNEDIQPVKSGQCEAWPSVAYDKYVLLNNSWNSRTMYRDDWMQKIHISKDNNGNTVAGWNYDWLGRNDGGEIEVKAYPEVLYGPKLGTHVSGSKAETGLPELVRNLPEFTVNYAYTETGNAERNVALESFFHDSCDIAGPCDEVDNRVYEMMIWVDNPSIRTPGDLALTGVMIDNRLWNVYIKPRSNKRYIAFTAQNPQTEGTLQWNRFVEWTQDWTAENAEALDINVLSPDFCMGAIEIGTELWWGAGSFTLTRFDVTFEP